MNIFVSFLRGINVGGRHKIKMADLKTLCMELGLARPRTLLQSGNLVFESNESNGEALARRLGEAIEKRFGFPCEIFNRKPADLQATLDDCPVVIEEGINPSHVLVMFLTAIPDGDARNRLLAANKGSEKIHFGDGLLYLHYPNGIGRSKLTNALIEKKLGISGTARNWNTLVKLLEMAQS